MLRALAAVTAATLWSALSPTQEPATAAAVTEPGRTLQRPLDIFLGSDAGQERTLLLLIEPSAGVAAAGLGDAFARALVANQKELANASLGLGVLGRKGVIAVKPGAEHTRVTAELQGALLQPTAGYQNWMVDLRTAVAALGKGGARRVLLVMFDNADVEDDLEQTVAALAREKVTLSVLTVEAALADSYWARHEYEGEERPRGTELRGGDGPVIDLPYGWLFQVTTANEVTPAGFAPYALNRLAAATGGRVHLYASDQDTAHRCSIYGNCLFCTGDHLATEEQYRPHSLAPLAPGTLARDRALAALGRDPGFRTTVDLWRRAAQEGLLHSQPPFKLQTTSATPDRARGGRFLDLFGSTNFARHQRIAEEAAAAAHELIEKFQRDLAAAGQARGAANAHYSVVMLQLTRVNLLIFAAWCRDIAPGLVAGQEGLLPPEVPAGTGGGDDRASGISYTNHCLCHGVEPFYDVELPGGAALRPELERLAAMRRDFLQRYAHTPYAYALARMGIATFHLTYPGIAGKVPRVRPKSGADTGPVTPTRPSRNSGGSSGAPSGPTTGGK